MIQQVFQPHHQLNRFPSALPVTAVQTYQVLAPLRTHFRKATCAEVDCPHHLHGWRSVLPSDDPRCDYIRHASGRRFTEVKREGGLTEFRFHPGQDCFAAADHHVRLEREERFLIRSGDHRGNPDGRVTEVSCASWTDDFGEHQEKLADQAERG